MCSSTKSDRFCFLQQNICNSLNIRGTPSVRIFYPGLASGVGVFVPHSMDLTFNRGEILKAIEIAQSHQLIPLVKRKNMMPYG